MKVVTIASQKGGAGKTTLTGHLAVAALMGGSSVAIIDADPQGSLADWWNQREAEDLPFVNSTIAELANNIQALRDGGIDFLFIDTPPQASDVIRHVVNHSDIVVVPTRPSPLDIRAVGRTVEIVDGCGKPMVFVVNSVKKNARITTDTAVGLSQHGTVSPVLLGDRGEFAISMIDGRTVMEVYPNGNSAAEVLDLWKYLKSQVERKVK